MMRMNRKAKGARRERQARTILEQAGYHVVKAGDLSASSIWWR